MLGENVRGCTEEESLAAISLMEAEDMAKCFPGCPWLCVTTDSCWDSFQFSFKEALKEGEQGEKVAS